MFGDFLESLALNNCTIRHAGNFRVHGGDIGVGTKVFKKCSCLGFSSAAVEYTCEECGRTPGNYVWTISGDGADEYPVFEIASGSGEAVGVIAVFDSPYVSETTIQSEIAAGRFTESEPLELAAFFKRWSLKTLRLGRLDSPGQLVLGDASMSYLCLTSSIEGTHATVFAFCEPLGKTDLEISKNVMNTEWPESPRPRVVAVLSDSLLPMVEMKDLLEVQDWPSLIFAWRTSMMASPESRALDAASVTPASKVATTKNTKGKEMAKCKSCGEVSPDSAKFCGSCGVALETPINRAEAGVETSFENKCQILADLWLSYRGDEQFEDFIEYNDLGLPLAYILVEGVAERNSKSDDFINETFKLLLELLEVEDEGYESIDELLEIAD